MDNKHPVGRTEFDDLEQSHSKLDRNHAETKNRLDHVVDQVSKLTVISRQNGAQLQAHGKELQANTQATKRIEANTEEIITSFQAVKAFFAGLMWVGEIAKKVAWVVIPVGAAAGVLVATWYGIWAKVAHWFA